MSLAGPRPNIARNGRLRRALGDVYRPIVRHYVAALAAYYGVITVAHLLMLDGAAALGMAAVSATTAALAIGVLTRLLDPQTSVSQLARAALFMGLAATANVTIHGIALQDPAQLDYLPLMAIVVALIGPTTRVVWVLLAALAAAFAAIAMATNPPGITHSLFVIAAALAAGAYAAPWVHGQNQRLAAGALRSERLAARVSAEEARNQTLAAAAAASAAQKSAEAGLFTRHSAELRALASTDGPLVRAALLRRLDALEALAAAEAGRLTLDPLRCRPADALYAAAAQAGPAIAAAGSAFNYDIPVDLGEADLDEARLADIVCVLLAAASETTTDGLITLRAWRDQTSLSVSVTDTSAGSADPAKTLLWAQAEALAQLLGGKLTLLQQPPHGARITLSIPAPPVRPAFAVAA